MLHPPPPHIYIISCNYTERRGTENAFPSSLFLNAFYSWKLLYCLGSSTPSPCMSLTVPCQGIQNVYSLMGVLVAQEAFSKNGVVAVYMAQRFMWHKEALKECRVYLLLIFQNRENILESLFFNKPRILGAYNWWPSLKNKRDWCINMYLLCQYETKALLQFGTILARISSSWTGRCAAKWKYPFEGMQQRAWHTKI